MMSAEPIKVAFFVPSLRGGGAEKAIVVLANEFSSRGMSVSLILAQREGPYLSHVGRDVHIVDLKASRVATCILKLAKYLRREHPYALITAMNHANIAAIVAKLIAGVRLRLLVVEQNRLEAERDAPLRHKLIVAAVGWAYRAADAVVAVSYGVADDLTAAGVPRPRIHVIHNPIVTDELLLKAQVTCAHPWFEEGQPPVILAVGRLETQKDFATLIRSFAEIRKEQFVRLLILGEGTLRPALEKLVADLGLSADVQLMGFSDNPYAFMSRASVFALSSTHEGLPTVLIEALACGLPVVSTDCPHGPAEILENGRWGRLVPVGNVAAIAAALSEAINKRSPDSWDERSRGAHFSAESSAMRYLQLMSADDRDAE
jgi:glycosyltransferase involved in cell wall biosynthesis